MINHLFKDNITKFLARVLMRFIIGADIKFIRLAKRLCRDKKTLLGFRDMWNLYDSVKKTRRLPGDIAELGVYSGGSAKLICETKGGKSLHLFDTFSGLPANDYLVNKIKSGEMRGGSLSEVKDYLAKYDNVFFYKGIFPASAVELKNQSPRFSLVHLDADIYEATLDGLKFFYPLMSKNGIILIHDYSVENLPGVKKAVSEFLKDKPEKIIELPLNVFAGFYPADQAMIIKR
jgi:hypothetical protein